MKNKHQKKQSNTVKQKAMIDSLIFQTNWGIKKLYKNPSDLISTLVKDELDYIIELNLFEDLLLLKKFIENVKSVFRIEPIAEYGDFYRSLVALALGIGKVNDIEKVGIPITWHELLEKKILSIYYPTDVRNSIVDYAKHNGYNVSTYLGKPIIKLSRIFVLLDRTKCINNQQNNNFSSQIKRSSHRKSRAAAVMKIVYELKVVILRRVQLLVRAHQ